MPARDAASTLAAGLVDANTTHLALLNTPRNVRDNLVTLDEVRPHCLPACHGGMASLTQGYRMDVNRPPCRSEDGLTRHLPWANGWQVGSGACASVYRAVYLPTLTVVAVKYFPIHDQARRRQVGR